MLHAIGWFFVLGLLALWSLGAWAFHSVAGWAIANANVLTGGPAAGTLRLPEWLAPWVPSELAQALTSMFSGLTPVIESLLGWAPALESGLSGLIWVVWALGSALLIVLGLVMSGAIAMFRRRSSAQGSLLAAAAR